MGRQDFGRLVQRKRKEKGWSQGRLAVRIGELPGGTYLDATGVRNLEDGKRAIEDDPDLFQRVIVLLEIDPDEAYVTLGLLPPGVDLDDIRDLRGKQTGGNRRRGDRPLKIVASSPAAEASTDQGFSTSGTLTATILEAERVAA